jgi:glycosyltransferase involved in cell wall biosynthesis
MLKQAANEKPVKVLYCIDNLLRGGTELQLAGVIERLDPQKYRPYLLTIRPSDPLLTPSNCTHLAWSVPKLFSPSGLKAVWQLKRWMKSEQIDIVQTFFQDSTVFGGLSAAWARVPARIACFRDLGFWHSRKQSALMNAIYPLMTAYLCNAEVIKSHFNAHFGTRVEKTTVLRNGIDIDALNFIDQTGETTDIGIVGNMTRSVKRTDLFIKAAAKLAPCYPQITWHVIGDGQMRPEFEALATELGVRDRMCFAGRIEDVPEYVGKLQIGVISSDSEGLSNALLEYMCKGAAVVATSVGGNVELIEHDDTGLLVRPNDPQALANALTRLIENPEFRQDLAFQARRKVEQQYSWSRCLREHDVYYAQALAGSKGKPNEVH